MPVSHVAINERYAEALRSHLSCRCDIPLILVGTHCKRRREYVEHIVSGELRCTGEAQHVAFLAAIGFIRADGLDPLQWPVTRVVNQNRVCIGVLLQRLAPEFMLGCGMDVGVEEENLDLE